MSMNLEGRILEEPRFAGVTSVDVIPPAWVNAPADEAPMGYWRKPNGYIILAHYGENGTERKLDRGFQRLGALTYGTYSSAAMGDLKDPLLGLVTRGGLHEMPAAQIKELGWHRPPDRAAKRSHLAVERQVQQAMSSQGISRAEAVLVVMPQLAGYDLTDYDCPACPGRFFPTEVAKINHTTVMHKEAVQSESIGKAVAAAQGGGDTAALLQIIAQQGDVIAGMKAQLDVLTSGAPKAPRGRAAKSNDTEDTGAE